jgi:hypothetical protein
VIVLEIVGQGRNLLQQVLLLGRQAVSQAPRHRVGNDVHGSASAHPGDVTSDQLLHSQLQVSLHESGGALAQIHGLLIILTPRKLELQPQDGISWIDATYV